MHGNARNLAQEPLMIILHGQTAAVPCRAYEFHALKVFPDVRGPSQSICWHIQLPWLHQTCHPRHAIILQHSMQHSVQHSVQEVAWWENSWSSRSGLWPRAPLGTVIKWLSSDFAWNQHSQTRQNGDHRQKHLLSVLLATWHFSSLRAATDFQQTGTCSYRGINSKADDVNVPLEALRIPAKPSRRRWQSILPRGNQQIQQAMLGLRWAQR